jgi:hypothetical protein
MTDLQELSALGELLIEAEKEVLKAEKALKEATAARDKIAMEQIPEALDLAGLEELKLKGGTVIGLQEILGVTVKKENKQRVLNWIEKEGHGKMIKRKLSVSFNKDQEEKVEALRKLLVDEHRLSAKEDREYASQTLKKVIKERIEEGKSVPDDIINIYQAKKAKFIKGQPQIDF